MSDVIDRDGFRANVGMVLMSDDGQLFMARRAGGRGWQFPQGGMRSGESVEDSLYRELNEEIGLAAADVQIVGPHAPLAAIPAAAAGTCAATCSRCAWARSNAGSCCACAGRMRRFRFDMTAEPEFDRWRWVDYWQPIREVIYFKRAVYTRALHELGESLAFPGGPPPYPALVARAAEP